MLYLNSDEDAICLYVYSMDEMLENIVFKVTYRMVIQQAYIFFILLYSLIS